MRINKIARINKRDALTIRDDNLWETLTFYPRFSI